MIIENFFKIYRLISIIYIQIRLTNKFFIIKKNESYQRNIQKIKRLFSKTSIRYYVL